MDQDWKNRDISVFAVQIIQRQPVGQPLFLEERLPDVLIQFISILVSICQWTIERFFNINQYLLEVSLYVDFKPLNQRSAAQISVQYAHYIATATKIIVEEFNMDKEAIFVHYIW